MHDPRHATTPYGDIFNAIVTWMQADDQNPQLTFSQRHFLAKQVEASLEAWTKPRVIWGPEPTWGIVRGIRYQPGWPRWRKAIYHAAKPFRRQPPFDDDPGVWGNE